MESNSLKKIAEFIGKKVDEAKVNGVIIGLSGGLDSSVAAALSVRALGKEMILGLIMPSPTTNPDDTRDAEELARSLDIQYKKIPLEPILEAFRGSLELDKVAYGNLMARVRMILLYYYANLNNLLVVGTGNKSELSVGYFTKYGDGGCDILPLGDLYKTEVRKLARELVIPEKIIEKTPAAGLWEGQTDEGELGIKYEELDKVLKGEAKSERVRELITASEHKRRTPEICRLKNP